MATLEELTVVAQSEIDAAKPMYAQVNDERREFTDAEYEQSVTDLAAYKLDVQDNGYKSARIDAYGSIADQLDMQYHDLVDSTTTWKDHVAKVKSDNPKP